MQVSKLQILFCPSTTPEDRTTRVLRCELVSRNIPRERRYSILAWTSRSLHLVRNRENITPSSRSYETILRVRAENADDSREHAPMKPAFFLKIAWATVSLPLLSRNAAAQDRSRVPTRGVEKISRFGSRNKKNSAR